jgi:hypothetical protein
MPGVCGFNVHDTSPTENHLTGGKAVGNDVTHCGFLRNARVGVAAGGAVSTLPAEGAEARSAIRMAEVCCSPRKGKTTASALKGCLEAAKG